jgi:hypothetical protein
MEPWLQRRLRTTPLFGKIAQVKNDEQAGTTEAGLYHVYDSMFECLQVREQDTL